MFENRHFFKGELDNIKVKDLKIFDDISINVNDINGRMDIVGKKITEVQGFLDEYYSGKSYGNNDFFKTSLNCSDELSENNAVCKMIEGWANYLLGSDEVREERNNSRTQYRFYIDETEFRLRTSKEESLDGKIGYTNKKLDAKNENDNTIIDFLIKKQENKKKVKGTTISRKDLEYGDYCSQVLSEYYKLLDYTDEAIKDIKINKKSKYKGKRYKLTKLKKDVTYDMIYCKDSLRGIFGEKPKNLLHDSTVPCWDKFDWYEESHIKALLYVVKRFDSQDDVSMLALSLDILLEQLFEVELFSKQEKEVIIYLRKGYKNREISKQLGITDVKTSRTVNRICKKICEYILSNWKIEC